MFKLGVATREVKNELSHEEQSLRALRQDYKEFTEGKDGSTMSALQEKFELLNGKKEKSDRFVTKKEVGTTEQSQYFPNFYDGFQTVTDSLGVFRSVKVPLVKSSNVVEKAINHRRKISRVPEKKVRYLLVQNNLISCLARYLNHNAKLKMEEEEALETFLGGHQSAKQDRFWGHEKRFEYTGT